MTLVKQSKADLIEVNEHCVVSVRISNTITENDDVVSRSFSRVTICPGDDYTEQCDRVKAICNAIHTPECVDAYLKKGV